MENALDKRDGGRVATGWMMSLGYGRSGLGRPLR
jgi:hypothetical protein